MKGLHVYHCMHDQRCFFTYECQNDTAEGRCVHHCQHINSNWHHSIDQMASTIQDDTIYQLSLM